MARKPKAVKKRKYTRRVVANALKEGFRGTANKTVNEALKSPNLNINEGRTAWMLDQNGGIHEISGGYAQAAPNYYQTKPHVALLREQFPGVWIRQDGAFRAEEYAIRWEPGGALPSVNEDGDRKFYGPRQGSCDHSQPTPVLCESMDFNRRGATLTLKQLHALTEYIKAESNLV